MASRFFLNNILKGRRFLDADADIQDMLQGVFAHDLFQRERVSTGMVEFGQVLDLDPVLIDIVHTAAGPPFLIVSQGQVIALTTDGAITRLPDATPDPDIIVVIGVGVAQDKVDIIAVGGVLLADIEAESRVIAALPFLVGEGHVLFEDIRWKGAGGA